MGLLDKAGGAGNTEDKPKVVAKAKAKPAAKAKAVAKQVVAEPVQTVADAKPVGKKEKKKREKKQKAPRPTGLPEGFELANKLDRSMSWFVNFGWNFGVLIAALVMMSSDTGMVTTILIIVSFCMMVSNVIILPIKTGRTLGQFVSRVKYIDYNGEKSNPIQGMLSNSIGIFSLLGLIMVLINGSKLSDGATPITFTVIGAIFVIMWIVNWQFKRSSQYNQGLYDLMFGAYLVKHVPTESEETSGFWAKFESMGDYGDKFAARREAKRVAREEKANAETENEEETENSQQSDDGNDDAKPKAKAKAKPKAAAKAKPKAAAKAKPKAKAKSKDE